MNNLSKSILILSIAILGVSALGVSCVQAQETNHIKVEVWDGTQFVPLCEDEECKQSIALFNEVNFLPGDDPATRRVRITNEDITSDNSGVEQKIGIQAIEITNPNVNVAGDKFGDVLYLQIKEGTNVNYESSLSAFFEAGETTISNPVLANNASAVYDFSVEFNPDAGNDYQSASLGFSLNFGLQGDEGGDDNGDNGDEKPDCSDGIDNDGDGWIDMDDPGCSSPTDNDESDEGGGGGGGIPLGLTIKYENSQVATTTATITWLTSYNSTSRVIYDKVPGQFDLYAGEPSYGYTYYTKEFDTPANPNGKTGHSITIYNLTEDTTYWFRCVSHASPDTIGTEHSFTTLGVAGDTGADEGDGAGDDDGDAGDGDGAGDTGDTGDSGDTGDTGGDSGDTGAEGDTGAGAGDDSGDTGDTGGEGDDFEYGDHIWKHQGDQDEDDLLSIIDDEFGDEDESGDMSKFLASIGAFFGDLEGWRLALMFLFWIILALIILRLIKSWIDRNKNKQ